LRYGAIVSAHKSVVREADELSGQRKFNAGHGEVQPDVLACLLGGHGPKGGRRGETLKSRFFRGFKITHLRPSGSAGSAPAVMCLIERSFSRSSCPVVRRGLHSPHGADASARARRSLRSRSAGFGRPGGVALNWHESRFFRSTAALRRPDQRPWALGRGARLRFSQRGQAGHRALVRGAS
jgi:hypothetical protein